MLEAINLADELWGKFTMERKQGIMHGHWCLVTKKDKNGMTYLPSFNDTLHHIAMKISFKS